MNELLKAKLRLQLQLLKRKLDPAEGITISHAPHPIHPKHIEVKAKNKEGHEVGRAVVDVSGHKYAEGKDVYVQPHLRRKGIASAMYDHVELKTGKKMRPSHDRTTEGKKLWTGNRASANPQFGKSGDLLKRIRKQTEVLKGAMQRLAPYKPPVPPNRDEGESKHVYAWQAGSDAFSREDIPHISGPGRTRALHHLSAATKVRRHADGGREFLLHRGMGEAEHRKVSGETHINHEHERSSWTPSHSVAHSMFGGGTAPRGKHTASAWVHEKHIVHVPKQIGGKAGRGNVFSQEHEVIVDKGHKSKKAAPEDVKPTGIHHEITSRGKHINENFPFHSQSVATSLLRDKLARLKGVTKSLFKNDHYYHTTHKDNLHDIHQEGVKTHKPWHGTEQHEWPDRSTEKRSYWSSSKEGTKPFSVYGNATIRIHKDHALHMKRESTGDHYSTKPISSKHIEVETEHGWKPLQEHLGLKKNDPIQAAFDIHGLHCLIEWPKGSQRKYKDGYTRNMRHAYGYIQGAKGDDGEELDCYIGDHSDSRRAFVIDKCFGDTKQYDEQKVMLGFRTLEEAQESFEYHTGPGRFMGIKEVPIESLRPKSNVGSLPQGEVKEEGTKYIVKSDGGVAELPKKFSIISGEQPRAKVHDKRPLEFHLKSVGYKYHKMSGKYGGKKETSYLVENAGHKHINHLAQQYGQESVIHSEGGKHKLHFTTGPNEGKHHKGEGVVHHVKEPKDNYSTHKGKHFTLNFDFGKLHK